MKATEIKVIRSKALSSQYEPRFVVVNTYTGEILDDANGFGYKTIQKAHAGYAYKSRGRNQVTAIRHKEALIFKWLDEHKNIDEELEISSLNALKDGVELKAEDVTALLLDKGYSDLPFTAAELLRSWKRGKPLYKNKKKHFTYWH